MKDEMKTENMNQIKSGNINTMKKYIFHINGMHCNACVLMTESEIGELPNVKYVKSNIKDNTLEIEGNFENKTDEEIIQFLNTPLKPHGYTVSVNKEINKDINKAKWLDFKIALPIAIAFAIVFIGLQRIGLFNIVNGGNVTYGTAFVIGIVASLSSCMSVVGGLLLSMSATFAKDGDKIKPQIMFHLGRIISFFILGGIIGSIGAVFTLSTSISFALSFLIGIVMLILGVNLLDTFPWAKKLQPSMPKFISKRAHGLSKFNHTLTPVIVGIATFFLPCGFTQSMQLYTLSTGNFLTGGFTMLAFALGTLPVLALISFSSFSIKNNSKSGIFFKAAGLIVIMFAIFNIINSLVVIGLISPVFNF